SMSAASCRQEATALPSISTVQVPHAPMPQPCLVPVSIRSSRSTSISTRSSLLSMTSTGSPLIVNLTCMSFLCDQRQFFLHALIETCEIDDNALVRALADALFLVFRVHAKCQRAL